MDVIICRCGTNLGALMAAYIYACNRIRADYKLANHPTIAIENMTEAPGYNVEFGALMDLLHVKLECCRAELLAKTENG